MSSRSVTTATEQLLAAINLVDAAGAYRAGLSRQQWASESLTRRAMAFRGSAVADVRRLQLDLAAAPDDEKKLGAMLRLEFYALVDMLHTAAVFQLDADGYAAIRDTEPPSLPELPPLPFPRITFELIDGDGDPNVFFRFEGHSVETLVLSLFEVSPGELWDIYAAQLMVDTIDSDDPQPFLRPVRFQAGVNGIGSMPPWLPSPEGDSVEVAEQWRSDVFRAALLVAHIVTAAGVASNPVQIHRQIRRGWERRFGVTHPTVYRVDLDAAGDSEGGGSGREYHCRWLVRGHWRLLSSGRRTWIRPYVKGPKYAPWRGRPIYTQKAS